MRSDRWSEKLTSNRVDASAALDVSELQRSTAAAAALIVELDGGTVDNSDADGRQEGENGEELHFVKKWSW